MGKLAPNACYVVVSFAVCDYLIFSSFITPFYHIPNHTFFTNALISIIIPQTIYRILIVQLALPPFGAPHPSFGASLASVIFDGFTFCNLWNFLYLLWVVWIFNLYAFSFGCFEASITTRAVRTIIGVKARTFFRPLFPVAFLSLVKDIIFFATYTNSKRVFLLTIRFFFLLLACISF